MSMEGSTTIIIFLFLLMLWSNNLTLAAIDNDNDDGALNSALMAEHDDASQPQRGPSPQPNHLPDTVQAPMFLIEPQDSYYVVKNKPLTLTCRVAHTVRIIFKCGGKWVDIDSHKNKDGVVPETGLKYLETTIEVTREQVDEYSSVTDGYPCECHAWNNMPSTNLPLTSKSKVGIVHAAYLRKRFEREPLSSTVELGTTKELTCLPPIGQPPAQVFWMKDNEEIDVTKDQNLIISHEGNLIINQARLQDHGNYTCGAQNMISRRLSESAFLTVYVNGGWSPWGVWSECGSKCTKSHQRRSRTCTSPSPLNGGTPCEGEAMQKLPCPNNCPEGASISNERLNVDDIIVDGAWSPWSSWSECSADCKQHRRRLCNSPAPTEGGRNCDGRDLDHGSCIRGSCRATDSSSSLSQSNPDEDNNQDKTLSSAPQSDTTATFVGLTLAVILFSLCLVAAVVIVRCRKRTPPSPQTKLVSQVQDIYMPPDVTHSLIVQQQQQQQQIVYQQQKQRLTLSSNNYTNRRQTASQTYQQQDGDSCTESPYCHLNFPQDGDADNDHDGADYDGDQQQRFLHQDINSQTYFQQQGTPFHAGFTPQHNFATHFNPSHSQTGSSSSASSCSSSQRPRSSQGTATNPSQQQSSGNVNSSSNKKVYNNIAKTGNFPVFQQQKNNIATNPHLYSSPSFSPMKGHHDTSPLPIHHRFPTGAGAVVWGSFSSAGGKISLDESDISLTVLSGSVDHNVSQDMFLAVSRDDKDRPKLSETQTILSPVVLCGPRAVSLTKPIIVSFQHCACLKQSQWLLSLYASDSPYDKPPKWELLCTVGSMPEEPYPQACVHVDSNRCHVMTDRPIAMLALVGEPCLSGRACKILRLAAFAPPMALLLTSPVDCSVRVYIIEDTYDALEGVMQIEQGLGGCLLDKPKSILFQFGGSNMCLSVENVASGWRNKMDVDCQEIPFSHIWSGGRNGLHCSVSLEKTETSKTANSLSCEIRVYQKNLPENAQILEINCDLTAESLGGGSSNKSPVNKNSSIGMNPTPEDERLPGTVRRKLCELLDEPNPRGNNWRMLAQTLNFERYMEYFSAKESPTEILLSMWQARHLEPSAVPDLMASLRLIGRQDAVDVIAKSLEPIHL